MRIWINITTDSGEVLERVAISVDPPEDKRPPDIVLAKSIIDYLGRRYEIEDDE